MAILRSVLVSGLLVAVALAPIPLGSNRDWSWSPLAAFAGGLLMLQAIVAALPDSRSFRGFDTLLVPAILVTLVVLWMVLQMCTFMPMEWENPLRAAYNAKLPYPSDHIIALDREQALIGLMRLLTYIGVFVVAADVCASARTARALYGVIVITAVLCTLYSMLAGPIGRSTGIVMYIPQKGQFTGSFINRNNYATYAAVAALIAIMMTMGAMNVGRLEAARESISLRWRRRLQGITGRGSLWLSASAILIVGVILSGSRAGWASLTLGVMAAVAVLARDRRRWWPVLAPPVALVLLAILMPGGNDLVDRMMAVVDTGIPGRNELFDLTIRIISIRPLLGWGANSFQNLYPVFQPTTMPENYDKAHNTYLEVACDLGIPAAVALVAAVIWIALQCYRGAALRRHNRELCAVGFCASMLVGLHSIFDFSLQIPGFTVVYAATLGAAWAQSTTSSTKS